jgi:hypothetical protein
VEEHWTEMVKHTGMLVCCSDLPLLFVAGKTGGPKIIQFHLTGKSTISSINVINSPAQHVSLRMGCEAKRAKDQASTLCDNW